MKPKRAMRIGIERTLGPGIAEGIARGLQRSVGGSRMIFNPAIRSSNRQLTDLENRHEGQRCIIVGNGPSLNFTDFNLLADEHIFALNRGYLKLDQVGLAPTAHVVVNQHVAEQFNEDISAINAARYSTFGCRRYLASGVDDDPTIYLQSFPGPFFSTDIRRGIWMGSTVTFVALQIAFFLGYKDVILIGVDHRFATQGPAHKRVVSEGADPNHFDPNYFGKGVTWQLPDLETSETAYRLANRSFAEAGRSITDCTVGGALTVFPRGELSEILASS